MDHAACVNAKSGRCLSKKDIMMKSSPASTKISTARRWIFENVPTLIDVPASALTTWKTEIKATARTLTLYVAWKWERLDWRTLRRDNNTTSKDDHLVLTTWEILEAYVIEWCQDRFKKRGSPDWKWNVTFGRVLVDEAHEVRGLATKFAKNLLQLAQSGICLRFITSTPLTKGLKSLIPSLSKQSFSQSWTVPSPSVGPRYRPVRSHRQPRPGR